MLADFRWRVYTKAQHPYNHSAADIAFSNDALPGVTDFNGFASWLIAVLYPQDKAAVADMAALNALVGNVIGDYRVVSNTGAGQAGGFRWEQREADATPKWYQIYAMNWGADSILESFLNVTQERYVSKYGFDDIDSAGTPIAGALAGQTIYGGRTAGKNLTLYPNAGDAGGAVTGAVQSAATFQPLGNNAQDLGASASNKWRSAFLGTSLVVGTTTLTAAALNDSSAAYSFSALNVTSTGWWKGASFRAGDGAAATPAYTFTTSTTTGWYQQAAGVVSLSSAGVEATRFGAAYIAGQLGTAAAPAYSFIADLATGSYQPAPSQYGIATAGIRRVLVDASGNVTFGTTTAYVDVSNGRFGLGTATPSAELHVLKSTGPTFQLETTSATGSQVGQFLYVASRAGNANLQASDGLGILKWLGQVGGSSLAVSQIDSLYTGDGTTRRADIRFLTSSGGAPAERMRIQYDGKIGMNGISAPAYTLDVTGGTFGVGNLFFDGSNGISAQNVNGGISLTPIGGGRVTVAKGLNPTTDNAIDLGATASRWETLYLGTGVGDGTNTMPMATLMALRDIQTGVNTGYGIFWNGTKWVSADPDTEVFHDSIAHLTGIGTDGDAGHSQFVVAAGRAAAQTIKGGTGASANLTLYSTAHATLGQIRCHSDTVSDTDGIYHLGAAAQRWANLYMSGQAIGLRVENYTTAGRPAASAANPGRLYWDTTTKDLYADNGGTWLRMSLDRYYNEDAAGWTGSVASVSYTVTGWAGSVKAGLWQFKDNANNYQTMQGALISHTSDTNVTVTFDNNLAAGTYTLVGIG